MEHWNFMEVFKNQDDDDGGSWSGVGNDVCKGFACNKTIDSYFHH